MKTYLITLLCGLLLATPLASCKKQVARIDDRQICPAKGPCIALDATHAVGLWADGSELRLLALPTDSLVPVGGRAAQLADVLLAKGLLQILPAAQVTARRGDLLLHDRDGELLATLSAAAMRGRRAILMQTSTGIGYSTLLTANDTIGIGAIGDDCSPGKQKAISTSTDTLVNELGYFATPYDVPDGKHEYVCIDTNGSKAHCLDGIGIVGLGDDNILPIEEMVARGNWAEFMGLKVKPQVQSRIRLQDFAVDPITLPKKVATTMSLQSLPLTTRKATLDPVPAVDARKAILRLPLTYNYARCGRTFLVSQNGRELWRFQMEDACTSGHFWIRRRDCYIVYSNEECPRINPPDFLRVE